MKRLLLTIVAMAAVGSLSAQLPDKTLAEAQIEYDRAVAAQKAAVDEVRSEEHRVSDAARARLSDARQDLDVVKEHHKHVVADQKRKVAEAKEQLRNANTRYKQESARTKQEIAAAKARTKSVVEEHKSAVARAKAEIARIKAEQHEDKVRGRR